MLILSSPRRRGPKSVAKNQKSHKISKPVFRWLANFLQAIFKNGRGRWPRSPPMFTSSRACAENTKQTKSNQCKSVKSVAKNLSVLHGKNCQRSSWLGAFAPSGREMSYFLIFRYRVASLSPRFFAAAGIEFEFSSRA